MKLHAFLSALAKCIACNKQQQKKKNQKLNKPNSIEKKNDKAKKKKWETLEDIGCRDWVLIYEI